MIKSKVIVHFKESWIRQTTSDRSTDVTAVTALMAIIGTTTCCERMDWNIVTVDYHQSNSYIVIISSTVNMRYCRWIPSVGTS